MTAKRIILAALVALQLADLWTTRLLLCAGYPESNPLVRLVGLWPRSSCWA